MGLVIPYFDKQDRYLIQYNYKLPNTVNIYNSLTELKLKKFQEQDLKDSLIVFCNFQSRKLKWNNCLYTNSTTSNLDTIVANVNKVLMTQAKLFHQQNISPTSIWLVERTFPFSRNHNPYINGTKLDNSLILESSSYEDVNHTTEILTHELLHRWFGGLIPQNDQNENQDKWFFEGFTDYYTYRTLLDSGLIDELAYIDKYNEILKEYFISPFNKLSDSEIGKFYWKGGIIQLVPYLRGHIIAQELNEKIITQTNNKYNLNHIMSELLKKSKKNDFKFSAELLNNIILEMAGLNEDEFINSSALLGRFHNLQPHLGKYALNFDLIKIPYYGFDIYRSSISGKISTIDKKSDAYKKGIREGQVFKGFSIDENHSIIKIQIKDKIKQIRVTPHMTDLLVPQYKSLN
jgi:predicted metalloprotease with PDZ domain